MTYIPTNEKRELERLSLANETLTELKIIKLSLAPLQADGEPVNEQDVTE